MAREKDNAACCPVCNGKGVIDKPTLRGKMLDKKESVCKLLRDEGYSVREIMRLLGFKSPRAVQYYLNK